MFPLDITRQTDCPLQKVCANTLLCVCAKVKPLMMEEGVLLVQLASAGECDKPFLW